MSRYSSRSYTFRKNRGLLLATHPLCVFCGAPADTADHIVPKSLGGNDAIDNLRPLCLRCNSLLGAYQRHGFRKIFIRRRKDG